MRTYSKNDEPRNDFFSKAKHGNFNDITLEDLNNAFIVSGSFVFDARKQDSDIDFLANPIDCRYGFAMCRFFNADREDYYDENVYSYSFHLFSGEKVNLIFFKKPEFFHAWRFATEQMRTLWINADLVMKGIMKIKKKRCDMFQFFVKLYLGKTES